MKFRVFRGDGILPINVCFRPSTVPSGNKWIDVEVNIKSVDYATIVVNSPIPFSYAVAYDLCEVYQAININAITNTNYAITLRVMTWSKIMPKYASNIVTDVWYNVTNDALSNSNKQFISNANRYGARVVEIPKSNNRLYFQTLQDIKELREFNLNGGRSALTTVMLPNGDKCALGVYTYTYTMQGTTADDMVLAMVGKLALMNEILVNAWVCDAQVSSFVPDTEITLTALDYPDVSATIRPLIPGFPVNIDIVDRIELQEDELLGKRFWKVGDSTIYPLMTNDSIDLELKSIDILGVGEIFRIYFSGDYVDIPKYKNFAVVELGYNCAPTVKTPSMYYNNKAYQVISDTMPAISYAQGITTSAGILSQFGKSGGFGGASALLGGIKNGLNADRQNQIDSASFGHLKKTGDVLNLLPFTSGEKQIFRYEDARGVYDLAPILNQSSSLYSETVEVTDVLYRKYLKCTPQSLSISPQVLQAGVYICRTETDFDEVIEKCC